METWTQQFDAYPHWFVWASLALTGLAVFWVLGRVMKWLFSTVLTLALLVVVGGFLVWAFA